VAKVKVFSIRGEAGVMLCALQAAVRRAASCGTRSGAEVLTGQPRLEEADGAVILGVASQMLS